MIHRITLSLLGLLIALGAFARDEATDTITSDRTVDPDISTRFTWGAEIGVGIDMNTNDMSVIEFGANFGLSAPGLPLLGVGAEVNMMMSNSCSSFPIYAIARTNFGMRHSPLFIQLKAGCIINNIYSVRKTNIYLAPGIGIYLARGRKFSSYLSVAYTYNGFRGSDLGPDHIRIRGLNYASVGIGVNF